MNIIKPIFIIEDDVQGIEMLKKIEKAGRTCYKSESKITDETAVTFIKNVLKRGHLSVIEHASITVRIICDRGVTHEIVRHRLASYSQECVAGDTQVKNGLTIKELYDRQELGSCYDRTHNKTPKLKSVDDDGNIVPNKMNAVFYKGYHPTYEIKTEMGYVLRCTNTHKFLTDSKEYKELKDLLTGNFIMVNGRPSLIRIPDAELKRLYVDEGLEPVEIANLINVSYRTIVNKLNSMGIFVKHLNDKNKEKYNKNHTPDSYEKMRKVILEQYNSGERTVWNKGLTEDEHNGVEKQGDTLRENHHNNGYGENNSGYQGKGSGYAKKIEHIIECELCGDKENLEVHHKDYDRTNDSRDNLVKVCTKCHNLLHHGWHIGIKAIKDKIISINYIGYEDVYDLEMMEPYHNYVANGFITHNSTRYCNYANDKFGEEITVIEPVFWEKDNPCYIVWKDAMDYAERSYFKLIELGAKAQEARSVLPNSLKTEIVMTMNLRAWLHFFSLRVAPGAHPQMREIAIPLLQKFRDIIPIIFDNLDFSV